jgi:hypothetical protein
LKLENIVRELNLKLKCCESGLNREVKGGYVGDLLSDVIANSKENDIWITRQIHQNIVAVASLKDLAGIILVQGAEPAPETVEKAAKEGIPVMVSDLAAFDIAGRVHRLIY